MKYKTTTILYNNKSFSNLIDNHIINVLRRLHDN